MPSPSPASAPTLTRILVRTPNWLGDAVMSIPALSRLREALPNAHISLLTPNKLADLWRQHPAANAVLPLEPKESIWSTSHRLRKAQFEVGLLFPNSFRAALEVWLARIPRRIGYRGQWRAALLTEPVESSPQAVPMRKRSAGEIRDLIRSSQGAQNATIPHGAHHILHYLRLVRVLGASSEPTAPRLFLGEEEVRAVLERFRIAASPPRLLLGLNPGAEYGPAKRWPADRFIAAAVEIHKQTNCRWIIFAGKAEVELANQITDGINRRCDQPSDGLDAPHKAAAINLAGATSLRELCALFKACRLLLTNDSGPMHLAGAVGTPVVALFGSTSPELTGPGFPSDAIHRLLRVPVPCAPCFRRECPIDFRCMTGITVEQVVEAVVGVASLAGV